MAELSILENWLNDKRLCVHNQAGVWCVDNIPVELEYDLTGNILSLKCKGKKVAPFIIQVTDTKQFSLNIEAEDGAELTILTAFQGMGTPESVINVNAKHNSRVKFYVLENILAEFKSKLNLEVEANSQITTVTVTDGATRALNEVTVNLNAEGAEAEIYGLIRGYASQEITNQVFVNHKAPHCRSYALYKGIYKDSSKGTFDGLVKVLPEAQKTDANQTVRSLLLSPDAVSHATPQLVIYADDVKCSHGSTVGQLDEEALFYLQSRGISATEAKEMLVTAFADEVLQKML